MDNKKLNGKNSQDPRFKHLDMDSADAVSATDFTGLIPANPQFVEDLDAYKEIHEFGYEAVPGGLAAKAGGQPHVPPDDREIHVPPSRVTNEK